MKYLLFFNLFLVAYCAYQVSAEKRHITARNIWAACTAINGLAVFLGLVAYVRLAA